jgi:hypothetical protein
MNIYLPEEVTTSSGEPFFADERAIGETLLIVVQKIDDNIGKLGRYTRWGV